MRYDDIEYCIELIKKKRYPKIHDDIFSLAKRINASCVVDLGCCHGLLSCRLADAFTHVIGIEPSETYLKNTVKKANVEYVHMKIEMDALDELRKVLTQKNVEAVFARRVIPEIWETGGMALCEALAKTFYSCGVKYVALEGRKKCKHPVNLLYNADRECEVFDKMYHVEYAYRNCRLLVRNK